MLTRDIPLMMLVVVDEKETKESDTTETVSCMIAPTAKESPEDGAMSTSRDFGKMTCL